MLCLRREFTECLDYERNLSTCTSKADHDYCRLQMVLVFILKPNDVGLLIAIKYVLLPRNSINMISIKVRHLVQLPTLAQLALCIAFSRFMLNMFRMHLLKNFNVRLGTFVSSKIFLINFRVMSTTNTAQMAT